jgi:hypothetical protein
MARRFSVVCLIFGILNIVVGFIPPVINTFNVFYVFAEPPLPVRNVDVAPPVWQHVKKEFPAFKSEVVGSSVCNGLLSLLLIGGAVGLFVNHDWGRWLSIGAAMLMILTFCIHDIYQLAVVRPALAQVFAQNLPPGGMAGEAEGNEIGFNIFWFFWCWINPILILYLLGMAITLASTRAFAAVQDAKQDADDDEPRRRRRYDADDY